jgi:3-deoxy-manno-octulosonate cytidylyltransferase (CMP-KDO synthetase)
MRIFNFSKKFLLIFLLYIKIKMKILGIIPARYASTRLPGKPLAIIKNKPMLSWVWEAATNSKLVNRVVIATDSEEICNYCKTIGAEALLSPSDLPNGTDRIIYTKKHYNLDYDCFLMFKVMNLL